MKQHVENIHGNELGEQNGQQNPENKKSNNRVWVFKCTICSESFEKIQDMIEHTKKSHEGKKFIRVNGINL